MKVPSLTDSQTAAKQAIDDALNNKKSEINGATNLDQPTKDKLIQDATDAADAAKKAIDKATTNNDVANEQTKGTNAIDAVKVPSLTDSQTAAKNAVDAAAAKQKELINNANNLSDSEKQDLNQQVDAATQTAKDAIDAATTNDGATKAGQDGVAAIEKVVPTSLKDAKQAANQVVDEALGKKLDEIKANTNLTDEEKSKLTTDANSAANDAKDKIKSATTNDGATKAGQDGKTAIEAVTVPTDSDVKKNAKDAIDKAAKAKNDAIDASNLTDEEKADLKQKVAEEVQKAKDNIDAATKDADVKTAQTNGEKAINNINVPATSATKDAAKDAIDDALAKKIEGINNANLTDDQKQSLIDQAQNAANQAKENVRSASTDEDVQTAKNNGIAAINGITVKSNSVDDQDKSATNEGNGNQAGYIQSDNSSDVTKHSSTQQSGNEKTQLPQTGNETQRGAGLVGLAIAGLVGLLGSAGFRKKRD